MGFRSTDFTFGVLPFGAEVPDSFSHNFESYFDATLLESGKIPESASKLCASWLLARLRSLDPSIPAETQERNDGGGYCLEIAAASATEVIAAFQIQGDVAGVDILGRTLDSETAQRVVSQLAYKLLEEPNDIAECCYRIVDPEWQVEPACFVPTPTDDSANEFGWRAGHFLGLHNIREDLLH